LYPDLAGGCNAPYATLGEGGDPLSLIVPGAAFNMMHEVPRKLVAASLPMFLHSKADGVDAAPLPSIEDIKNLVNASW
jgi:hypothetical protein